ncbi:MAG: glycosyltransferase family 4 protein [Syntrophobacteraceae bacterium]|jgi:glycosyltransferase involved in cell wall biosynthesis
MKINILTGAFIPLPPAGCGAVERVWHGLAPYFASQGDEVTFYARAHPSQASDEIVDGVRYVRRHQFKQTGSRPINILKGFMYAQGILRVLKPADIFICNDFCTGLLSPYVANKYGKLVLNVQRMPKKFLRGYYEKSACLVAVSEATRNAIGKINAGLLDKTYVVPNPVYTDVFHPPLSPRNNAGPQTLLYTGRIHPEKGLHLLVKAFARVHQDFPQLRLKIVGPWRHDQGGGGGEYLQRLSHLASGLPVEFGEPLNDVKDLAKLLQGCHFYCYPSLAEQGEAFGVAALEACATGLVPVVSDLTCFQEFVRDGDNGIVFNHRSEDPIGKLVEALRRVLADPEHLEKMGALAVETANNFSYAKIAARYMKVFDDLFKNKRAKKMQGQR